MAELKKIYQPIRAEMDRMERQIRAVLRTSDSTLKPIVDFVLASPGKRLRPALVLFAAKVGGRNQALAVDLAVTVELIHTATLVQDDVIDRADLRRGRQSVRRVFGNDVSILFGDYLYSKAFSVLSKLNETKVFRGLLEVTSEMAAGEIEQLNLAGKPMSRAKYFTIIRKKTANLFSACCRSGGLVGGAQPAECRVLADFGLFFGLAFQVVDDYRDAKTTQLTLPRTAKDFGRRAVKALAGLPDPKLRKSFSDLTAAAIWERLK